MSDEDIKKIKSIFDSLIKPLRDEVAVVNKNVKDQLHLIHPRIDMIGSRQEMTNDKLDKQSEVLDNHTKRLEALAGDTETLISQVKALNDKSGMFHSRNKREIDEIKKHLNLPIISDRPEI